MTGRELSDKLNYLGMERRIRKLALEEKLETAEKKCGNDRSRGL